MIGATNGELHVEKNKVFGYQQIGSYETRVYLYLETDGSADFYVDDIDISVVSQNAAGAENNV